MLNLNEIEERIYNHYLRSESTYRGKHPKYKEFAAHYIHSRTPYQVSCWEPKALKTLKVKYLEPRSCRISQGGSYWCSPHFLAQVSERCTG